MVTEDWAWWERGWAGGQYRKGARVDEKGDVRVSL